MNMKSIFCEINFLWNFYIFSYSSKATRRHPSWSITWSQAGAKLSKAVNIPLTITPLHKNDQLPKIYQKTCAI